jgi:hypothetical protein
MRRRRAGSSLCFACEEQRDCSYRQHDPDHGECIAEARDHRLPLHDITQRDDRLMPRRRDI